MGSNRTAVQWNNLKNANFVAVFNQNVCVVVAFCAENTHVQGFLLPALNSVKVEICISFGQAGLQTLKELEKPIFGVQKWQEARDR